MAFGIVGAVILAAGVRHATVGAAVPSYGDALGLTSLTTSTGEHVTLAGDHWTLLIVGSIKTQGDLIGAAQRLMVAAHIPKTRLRIVPLLSDSADQLKRFASINTYDFPMFSTQTPNNAKNLREQLGLTDQNRHVYLVRPNGRIEFSARFAAASDLRQLLERHLSASGPAQAQYLRAGATFAPSHLLNVRNGNLETALSSTPRLWIVFTAECVTCALESRLLVLSTNATLFRDMAAREHRTLALVFSPTFNRSAVEDNLDRLHVPFLTYVSTDGLPNIEDAYSQHSLVPGDTAFVIRVDRDQHVEDVKGLSETALQMSAAAR